MSRPEDDIHRAIIGELAERKAPGVVYWHTPNQGKRGYRRTNGLKALGMRPGVSDLVFLHKGRFFALELKAPSGKPPTEDQMEFVSDVNAAGGSASIVEGLPSALSALEIWGILRRAAADPSAAEGLQTYPASMYA